MRDVRSWSWMERVFRKRFAIRKWVPRVRVRVRETIWFSRGSVGRAQLHSFSLFLPLHRSNWNRRDLGLSEGWERRRGSSFL